MFIYKTTAELEAMSAQELDAYKTAQKAHEKAEADKAVKEAVEKATEPLSKELKAVQEDFMSLKEQSQNTKEEVSFYDSLKNAIAEKREDILSLKDNINGAVTLTVNKAVVNMTFATNTTGRIGRVEVDPNIYGLQRKNPFLGQLIDLGQTNARTYVYVDKTGHEGAPAMTAEGALKPVGDWNLVEKTVNPKKVAFIVTVSKEMLDDIDNMTMDIYKEIQEQIVDVMEQQWLSGDGTGDNIVGISTNAVPFAAGAQALKVVAANELDAIRVAIKQVELNNFYPTAVLVNPSAVATMDLTKITDGQYILPPFTSSDGTVIKGIPVISNPYIGLDDFYVGDFKKFKGKIREGITIDVGYKDGDWQKNFISFRGEARFFGYIPTNHFGAIVKGTFTAAKTALLKP